MEDAAKQQLTAYARSQSSSRLARTLGALCRSDKDRLEYWPGSLVVPHGVVEQMDRPGDSEAAVIEAAERFAELRACIGFVLVEGGQPQASAWLVTVNGGAVIDPARQRRNVLGCLGIQLTPGEAARWSPTQRGAVAERDSARHRVLA